MTEQITQRDGKIVSDQATSVMLIDVTLSRQPRQYNSVRVGVTLPVFVTQEDDVHVLLARHLVAAKAALEAEVDNEFESYGEPAVYSQGPRFMLLLVAKEKLVVIVPQMRQEDLPGAWPHARIDCEKHRLSYVRRQALDEWSHYRLVDCSDGDFSKLPPLDYFDWHHNEDQGLYVLVLAGIKIPQRDRYPGWWRSSSALALRETLAAELSAIAAANEAAFFDCADGDFSRLPAAPSGSPAVEDEDISPDDEEEDEEFYFDNDDDDPDGPDDD